jgi:putative hydrolase of the HAD superfamily
LIAVTFDFGQTICEIDLEMLARRLGERDQQLSIAGAKRAEPAAWRAYNDAKASGSSHELGWCTFMTTLLVGGTVSRERAEELAIWLWNEQPTQNLWRRPIAGMFELVRDLHALGVPLGIISNSEGKLRELAEEIDLARYFRYMADSGLLGFEKPDARIFQLTADQIGVRLEDLIHVGDAWAADVVGAVNAGARAIWFSAEQRQLPDRVERATTADEVRRALDSWGVAGILEHRG